MAQDVSLDLVEFKLQMLLRNNVDLVNREYLLHGPINSRAVTKLQKGLSILHSMSEEPITISIMSQGGDIYSMFAIIDLIRTFALEVATKGVGFVASAAVPILAAGDKRYCTEMCYFMVHGSSYGVPSEKVPTHEVELKHTKETESRVNRFMTSVTDKPYSFWAATGKHTDFFFNATKAVEYGLVDEVVE